MTLARIRRALCLAGIALGFAAAYACSLNPQPLPPGDTPEGGKGTVGDDASTVFGGADSGGQLAADGAPAGNPPDGSSDGAATPNPPEGGDAGDAESDGEGDGATDAPVEAPADAATDGEEGG
jgi:hypothetical protein